MGKHWGKLLAVAMALALIGGGAVWWFWPCEPRYGGRTATAWIEAMQEADPVAGLKLAEELAALGEGGLPVLLRARTEDDMRVHRLAALGLVLVGEKAAAPVAEVLGKAGPRAEVVLARIGKPAVPALVALLARKGNATRRAAHVLGAIGPDAKAALRPLTEVVEDEERNLKERADAVQAIGLIGPEQLDDGDLQSLITAARRGPAEVRELATYALGRDSETARKAAPSLLANLNDDEQVARATADLLSTTAGPPVVAALARRVLEKNDVPAAVALARLGKAARPAAAELIGGLGQAKSEPLARATLERLGTVVLPDLIEALEDRGAARRVAVARTLAVMGPRARSAAPALVKRLKDAEADVVLACAEALVLVDRTAAGPAVAPLAALVAHKDEKIALAAVRALGALGPAAKSAVPALQKVVAGDDAIRAVAAAVALGEMGEPGDAAQAALVKALAAEEKVAQAALEWLRRLGAAAKSAAPVLLPLLDRPKLRGRAAVVLLAFGPGPRMKALAALEADLADEATRGDAVGLLLTLDEPPTELVERLAPLLGKPALAVSVLRLLDAYPADALLPVVPNLMDLMEDADAAPHAARQLRRVGAAALPGLRRLLRSKSPTTFATAARTGHDARVKLVGDDLDALAARAGDDGPLTFRIAAASVLAARGVTTEASAQVMLRLLDHERAELRHLAAAALGGAPEPQRTAARAALLAALYDPNSATRQAAATSLGKWGEDEVVRTALAGAARSDPDLNVRAAAAAGLVRAPASLRAGAAKELARQAAWLSPGGRAELLRLIHDLDAESAGALVPVVEADLRDQLAEDRLRAAYWLARLAPERLAEARALLLNALLVWDEDARRQAAVLLGELGDREALPELERAAAQDAWRGVRTAAREAVLKIGARKKE